MLAKERSTRQRKAVVLVSLGSSRFSDANCDLLLREATKSGFERLTWVFLDSLELTNLRVMFALSSSEAARVVQERTIRLSTLLSKSRLADIRLYSELIESLPTFKARLSELMAAYETSASFARAVQNQVFRNLHPILKRLGVRNSRAPLLKELSIYLVSEIALRRAIHDLGEWEVEFSLNSDDGAVEAALAHVAPAMAAGVFISLRGVEPSPSGGLEVGAVSYRYPSEDRWALDSCSLQCASGEIIGVLGKSGCGKSTLLRVIAGHLAPSSGSIAFSGVNVTALPPARRQVATVFQDFALFPHLTVRENVAFGLESDARYSAAQVRELTAILLERFRLTALSERLPGALSGGQKQRTAIARALALAPSVLLLDEPTASLDFENRDELAAILWRVVTLPPAPTIILVSHDRDFVLDVATTVAVMDAGRVIAVTAAREIIAFPQTPLAASIIGSHLVLPMSSPERARASAPANGRAFAIVRNNDITISRIRSPLLDPMPENGPNTANVVSGRVLSKISGARHTRVTVQLDEGSVVTVRTDADEMTEHFDPGDHVELSFTVNNSSSEL